MIKLEQALLGHTSEETAYLVEDYPYGFRLRTQIRYWLETTKHGDRLVSQTLNPKTDRWNKSKKSTYAEVGVMYLDDEDHVTWMGISAYADKETVEEFYALFGEHLSVEQKAKFARLMGWKKALENVTWSIRETTSMTPEEIAAADAEQALAEQDLRRLAAFRAHQVAQEIGL